MKKYIAVLAAASTVAALPATAGATQHHHRANAPTTGLVCQPHGVNAKAGWAIQYDESTLKAERFVRPFQPGVGLGKGFCMRFVDGRATAFVASPF